MEIAVGANTLRIMEGDITDQATEAVVNAANSSLMGGGGVDGAIHRRGGPMILEECKRIRSKDWPEGLPTGKAVITTGGALKAKYVIHTVGPVWQGGTNGEPELLADSYRNSLALAKSKGLGSVAFPSISTGAYGYPLESACKVALRTIRGFLEKEKGPFTAVLVLFRQDDFRTYVSAAEEIFRR